mmetsp:Transcript_75890/g.199037  ORF Transcript_75890/g.199037 Transcript_75890/m.199037 type:complete len:410 (-) Transcript_75890:536-1765(-)
MKRFRPPNFWPSTSFSSSGTLWASSSLVVSLKNFSRPCGPDGQPSKVLVASVRLRMMSCRRRPKPGAPYGPLMRSMRPKPKASPPVPSPALRSPRVMAPRLRKRRVTADTKRASPARSVTTQVKLGGTNWLERCTRPSCCTALSAAQGSSRQIIRRGRTLTPARCSRRSLCSEMPAEAASVMMAKCFCPRWKARCSAMFTESAPVPFGLVRGSRRTSPVRRSRQDLCDRPDISATASGPPSWSMSSSSGFGGSCSSFSRCLSPASDSAAHSSLSPRRFLVGMCLSRNCSRVSSGPERNPSAHSSASAPPAAALFFCFLTITDSLVVHKENTTHSPLATAARPSATACGTFAATIRPLKKRCWLAQKRLSTDLPFSSLKASAVSRRSSSCRRSCQMSTAASYCCRICGVS